MLLLLCAPGLMLWQWGLRLLLLKRRLVLLLLWLHRCSRQSSGQKEFRQPCNAPLLSAAATSPKQLSCEGIKVGDSLC